MALTDFQKRAARELFGDELAARILGDAEAQTKSLEASEGFKAMAAKAANLLELVEPDDTGENYDTAWASGSRWARGGLRSIAAEMSRQMNVNQNDVSGYFFGKVAPQAKQASLAPSFFGATSDTANDLAERRADVQRRAYLKVLRGG